MKTSRVLSVSLIKRIKPGLDYCEVVTTGFEALKCFYDLVKLQSFIGKDILFDTMSDVYEGVDITRIANIAVKNVINTVQKTKNVSLIPVGMDERGVCNCSIEDIKSGDTQRGAIVYLSSFYLDGSIKKARWRQLIVVDIKGKVYEVKVFGDKITSDTETEDKWNNMIGNYIKLDISNTRWGYQAELSSIEVQFEDVVLSPQVELAKSIIPTLVEDDLGLLTYMQQYDYLENLANIIEVEPGFHLVRVACELSLAQALTNITDTFSYVLIRRAIITSRGYLINKKNNFSKIVVNSNKILRSALKEDMELLNTIDVMSESSTPTKRLYITIRKIVNQMIDERRGNIDEKEVMAALNSISDSFGGLL